MRRANQAFSLVGYAPGSTGRTIASALYGDTPGERRVIGHALRSRSLVALACTRATVPAASIANRRAQPISTGWVRLARRSLEHRALFFEQPPIEQLDGSSMEARVAFAFEHAPQERLHAGARFGVYYGRVKIADVDVLD